MTADRIMALGAELGFPPVRFTRAEILLGGERAWTRYVASMTPIQHERLVEAIRSGWASGPGERGLVRTHAR